MKKIKLIQNQIQKICQNLKNQVKIVQNTIYFFVIENGIDEYVKLRENERNKDREFVELFKRNYDEIVKFISLDPKQRIAVDCFTCIKGMDLSKQYGKLKRKE